MESHHPDAITLPIGDIWYLHKYIRLSQLQQRDPVNIPQHISKQYPALIPLQPSLYSHKEEKQEKRSQELIVSGIEYSGCWWSGCAYRDQ